MYFKARTERELIRMTNLAIRTAVNKALNGCDGG